MIIIGTLLAIMSGNLFSQNIEGNWQGNLEVQKGKKMLFIFNISEVEGKLRTKLEIPSQGLKELQPTSTTFLNNNLLIDASNLGFKYDGKWNALTGKIEGTFQEGVNSVPLIISKEKLEKVDVPKRPQEPTKPYPYQVENVQINNQHTGIILAGTLTLPKKSTQKPPVVILISGSGPQDRDESFMGHRPFLILSDYLTRQGIAVLRYDDRGFGESSGDFDKATTADFSNDVLSAIEFLKKRSDIDTNKIGLIGHSEGAIIAPKVANQSPNLAFIIMLAGTGTVGKEVSLIQALEYRNFPVEDEEQYKVYVQRAIAIASSNKSTHSVKKELTEFYQQSKVLSSILPSNVNKDEFIENLVLARTNPWIRYFYNYNPTQEIRKINIPALALYGSKDTQVPPKYHLQHVKEALMESNSKNYEVILIDGLNHLFQNSETGHISEYTQIEETMSPKVLEKISNWILNQV